MKINFGIIAVKYTETTMEVAHFVGYEKKPTLIDFENLRKELETDEAFGLTQKMDELELIEAPEPILAHFKEEFENNEWIEESEK